MKKNTKILFFAIALFLAAAACTVDLGDWKFWEKSDATEEPSPALSTFTPIPTLTPMDSAAATPTFTVVVPTITPEPQPTSSTPSTTATGALCLPGTWQINHDSVTNYIYLTMIGIEQYGFSPKSSSGTLQLQIDQAQVVLMAEDFTVGVDVQVGEITDIGAFTASIDADGYATYVASYNQIVLTNILYDADGEVTSLSATFSVDFDDLLDLAQTLGFAEGISNPITYRVMYYTCSGDILTIQVNPYASVIFNRVLTP
jgi:hypothetical protein